VSAAAAPRRPTVAILLPDLRGGGVERVRLVLAREFLAAGYDVEFVLQRVAGDLLVDLPPGATVHDLRAPRVRDLPLALVRWFRTTRADAVLAAMWPLSGLACVARRLAGRRVPLVVSEHSDFRKAAAITPLERRLLRLAGRAIYGAADHVVCVSAGVASSLTACAGVPAGRMSVIHNPVPGGEGRAPLAAERELIDWWGGGGRRVLAIGNLKPAKAFDLLLDAFARRPGDDGARLLVLGDGPLRPALEAQVAALGLSDRVRLPGFQRDPRVFLRAADLFVLSSRWEGFGNVIVEALACGVPVVATDCLSGPAEILEGGRYGRLVPVDDPAALAAAMGEWLAREHDRAALVARAADFAPPIAAGRYLALLFGAAAAAPPPRR
jgi:glycosyltransferase involved in cell wall biosynthesis